ncbi:MAG TPA: CorA family divalent cation transporter, partial [Polyangiaceae bacterium]
MSLLPATIVPDIDGLICAFELAPLVRRGRDLLVDDVLPQRLWMHFNLSNGRTQQWLQRDERISEEARAFLLDSESRSRVEPCGEAFGVVLGDLHHDFDSDPEGFGPLRLFVSEHLLISARTHPLRTPDLVRRDLLAGLNPGCTISLFEHFVRRLAETFATVVANLGEAVDDAEDRVLGGQLDLGGRRLGSIRRLLARLRRHINGNRTALARLPTQLPEWCDADQRRSVREAIERLATIAQDLDLVQERARLLQEEIAGRVGEATNRNLYLLSIM